MSGRHTQRRNVLRALFAAAAGFAAWTIQAKAGEAPKELRIGFQKSAVNLILLKQRKALEKRLPDTRVAWFGFAAGAQMLEALSVGSVDVAVTGDAPPIFAQASGSKLVYVGVEPPQPDSSAVLVRADSPVRTLAGLKGKRIAFQHGSGAHTLVALALQQNGLSWRDVTPVPLAPAEARTAFERGSVDAWAIGDPYLAAIEKTLSPRVLGTSRGLAGNRSFYLASRSYADKYPEVVRLLFEELTESDAFVRDRHAAAVSALAAVTGFDESVIDTVLERRPRSPAAYLGSAVLDEQQAIADTFFRQGLIPQPIRVADMLWQPPPQYAYTH